MPTFFSKAACPERVYAKQGKVFKRQRSAGALWPNDEISHRGRKKHSRDHSGSIKKYDASHQPKGFRGTPYLAQVLLNIQEDLPILQDHTIPFSQSVGMLCERARLLYKFSIPLTDNVLHTLALQQTIADSLNNLRHIACPLLVASYHAEVECSS
jgi:hypothetical protein